MGCNRNYVITNSKGIKSGDVCEQIVLEFFNTTLARKLILKNLNFRTTQKLGCNPV